MEFVEKLLDCINRCLVPKLAKNYDEENEHPEFDLRNSNLETNFQLFVESLGNITEADLERHPQLIANIFILYKELSVDCPWNNSRTKDIAKQLNTFFEVITTVHLDKALYKNDVFDGVKVFDKCLESIHSKLTYETFRMYPAQIEVYISILKELQDYNIKLLPTKIFPITLLLIEDYSMVNKKKGLQSCSTLLQSMEIKDFCMGNYYEVIYRSLKKNLVGVDIDIVKLTHICLLALLQIVSDIEKARMLEELYSIMLDQVSIDSNLYKKAACFNFASTIIQWHKENCVIRNDFKQIICDNLDLCTYHDIEEITLGPLLKCLQNWIIYCWPMWNYKTDYKMLASLFKVLYTCQKDPLIKQAHEIIVALINLSTSFEQEQIINNLDKKREIQCEEFLSKINKIKFDLEIESNR